MMSHPIIRDVPLTRPWAGNDPFLLVASIHNLYPPADHDQGVSAERLSSRPLGADFSGRDGFSMYHGSRVPGFPAHPHRGIETVTFVSEGLIDHTDSMGASARYGDGDVQWLTTGRGAMHAEMFPLRNRDGVNPLRLHQLWLNLPSYSKMVEPTFRMFWSENIPHYRTQNDAGAVADVTVIAGAYVPQEPNAPTLVPPAPPPSSWASRPEADVAIWHISLDVGARLALPPAQEKRAKRTLYIYVGDALRIAGRDVGPNRLVELDARAIAEVVNQGVGPVKILLLQGVPITEPVFAQGPYVKNTQAGTLQAQKDFEVTGFCGWPWPVTDPVQAVDRGRFAHHPDETDIEFPPGNAP